MIGTTELLIILLVAFLIFGAKRLPEIGGALGKAIKDFKKAVSKPDEIDVTPKKEEEEKKEEDEPKG
jgi:sec-independent protein translocase protein TatA